MLGIKVILSYLYKYTKIIKIKVIGKKFYIKKKRDFNILIFYNSKLIKTNIYIYK